MGGQEQAQGTDMEEGGGLGGPGADGPLPLGKLKCSEGCILNLH